MVINRIYRCPCIHQNLKLSFWRIRLRTKWLKWFLLIISSVRTSECTFCKKLVWFNRRAPGLISGNRTVDSTDASILIQISLRKTVQQNPTKIQLKLFAKMSDRTSHCLLPLSILCKLLQEVQQI